ncbi:alpha/beta fold hydrolase [Rhizobium tumorigenes]|uniref:Alpha/beta hydrolase n=1 Tax=Rhizobium tumorigenes TaxID=2041385 RepID=A0AAF1KU14_9HYPH|nr:alpha/beta hydrolase [Rhizobium tumorigenes]WFR97930.1 alpha/beta hydrolase [Rhizobium tumorigenes]
MNPETKLAVRGLSQTIAALTMLLIVPMATEAASTKPTIVLVHGAMADSSSWNGVIPLLSKDGYNVVAVADPLRSVAGDAALVASVIKSINGPVVLVGHSYGGVVITNAVNSNSNNNVTALVYVAAFAPEKGESAFALIGKFPGSELGAALAKPVTLSDGGHDLSVDPAKFAGPFAADLPHDQVTLMAITQRPVTEAALKEASGPAAWRTIPSYFVYGAADKSIPPALHAFMAKRAQARDVVVVPDASHVVMLSHPQQVADVIVEAAQAD